MPVLAELATLDLTAAGFPRPSIPDGYGMKSVPADQGGGISAWNDTIVTLQMTGALIQGGPMEEPPTSRSASPAPCRWLSAWRHRSGRYTDRRQHGARMTVGLNGTGAFQLTGTNNPH